MLRRAVIGALFLGLAGAVAAPAHAYYSRALMPGVVYSRQLQFTAHGPVVLHVITAPRPGGLLSLQPVLAGGTVTGRARVTAMQRAISDTATVAGINGDLFNWTDGHPTGIVMQGGVIKTPPYRDRSSIGISQAGDLAVARVSQFGYWQDTGIRHPLSVNKTPQGDGTAVFTPAWGARTPLVQGAFETVVEPYPPVTTGAVLDGTVVAQSSGGGTPIPRDGAVLLAIGSQAPKLAAETPPGSVVHTYFTMTPNWPGQGILDALGGGPVTVRNGQAVWTAGEDFLPQQLGPRDPRTGIGQRRDGKIVMVVVDGRRPGYSVGLTNFELAQAMVRLGVYTGSALDSGGSSTIAFDGQLLNRPSDPGGERAVKEMLALEYTGIYGPPPDPVLSPNGDGVNERETLVFKLVRPSNVNVSLLDPGGTAQYTVTGDRRPGTYQVTWPNNGRRGAQLPLGRWRWVLRATDDLGRASAMERGFWVNDTLGFLQARPRAIRLRRHGRNTVSARFRLLHAARVTGSVWTRSGALVRKLRPVTLRPGTRAVRWNGRYRNGRLAYRGRYVFKVYAQNAYGPVTLEQPFVVR